MDMPSLALDETEFFQSKMRVALTELFAGKVINSTSAYFRVWQQLREILEDELEKIVNAEMQKTIEQIKNT